MASNVPTTISGALTPHELEEILMVGTSGFSLSCLSFVRYSIVVFRMPAPTYELHLVNTIPIASGRTCAQRCTAEAKAVAAKIAKTAVLDVTRDMRTIDIVRDDLYHAVQTQIVFRNPALGSVFAILLPDIAWSRYFPAIAGPLVAVVATKLSLPEDKPRTLRVLCSRKHAAAQMLEDEKKWRAAAADARPGAAAELRFDVRVDSDGNPHASFVLNTPGECSRIVGWDAFPVALMDILGAHWEAFADKHCVPRVDEDIDSSGDE